MQWFWDISAQVYFMAMLVPLAWMTFVHATCLRNLNVYPGLHMDEELRQSARDMHGWMAAMAVGMIFMTWAFLPWMESLCATEPLRGLLAHGPLVAAIWGMAINGTNHLKIQLRKIDELGLVKWP